MNSKAVRGRRAGGRWLLALFACALCAAAAGQASTTQSTAESTAEGAAAAPPAGSAPDSGACTSLVMRRCGIRRTAPSLAIDPEMRLAGFSLTRWAALPDLRSESDDEIVVTGERIRGPTVHEVMERNLGGALSPTRLLTGDTPGGARCTTIVRTGATLCTNSPNVLPGLGNLLTDWTF